MPDAWSADQARMTRPVRVRSRLTEWHRAVRNRATHFAALLHLSPSTYNYYEKGRIPPVDVLDRAARVTGVPLLWLIRGEPTDFSLESLKKIDVPVGTSGDAGMVPATSNGTVNA